MPNSTQTSAADERTASTPSNSSGRQTSVEVEVTNISSQTNSIQSQEQTAMNDIVKQILANVVALDGLAQLKLNRIEQTNVDADAEIKMELTIRPANLETRVGRPDNRPGRPDNRQTMNDGRVGRPDNRETLEDGRVGRPDNRETMEDDRVGRPDNRETMEDDRVGRPDNRETMEDGRVGRPDNR